LRDNEIVILPLIVPPLMGQELPRRGDYLRAWHLAKTIAAGVGLTNAWLADQGLLSLKTLWGELAPLR
jgi:hypothetical protein